MLGIGPFQSITSESSLLTNPQFGFLTAGHPRGFDQHKHSQLHQQALLEPQLASTQLRMDEFLDQMFPQSWPEKGAVNKAPWDVGGASTRVTEAPGGLLASQRHNTVSSMPYMVSELHTPQGDVVPFPFDDTLIAARLQQQCTQEALGGPTGISVGSPLKNDREPSLTKTNQELSPMRRVSGVMGTGPVGLQLHSCNSLVANSSASSVLAGLTTRAPALATSPSVGSCGTDGSGCPQSSPNSQSNSKVAAVWHQPYVNGVLPTPLGVAQANAETFLLHDGTANDANFLGKRSRFDEDARGGGSQDSLFGSSSGGAQLGPSQTSRTAGQPSHQMQGAQEVIMPSCGTHTCLGQSQVTAAVVTGTARPRVRARRGQATDPHSIAERLRRERIAERMKALQELVPNSNKTDKSSMLDEIIEYVKFLQLQVKVLSMSRLGGAGAVAPLLADLLLEGQDNLAAAALGWNAGSSHSSQDGMAVVERQVARLMEEDMGSAMQFLQSRGLCLMPVSLATAISSTNVRSVGVMQGLMNSNCLRVDAPLSMTVGGCSSAVASGVIVSSLNSGGLGDGDYNDGATKASNDSVQNMMDSFPSSIVERTNASEVGLPLSAT